ncbi:MAG: diguanylate cyclase [Gammaproteobacteria bacterium]|nr:diguanylate cyclase [Gammaproteobacteria bacterium]
MWFSSLRIAFPILITISALTVVSVSYLVSKETIEGDTAEIVKEKMRNRLNYMQGAISFFSKSNDDPVSRQFLSSVFAERDFVKLMVVDSDGIITTSSEYRDVGRFFPEVFMPIDQGKLEVALAMRGTEVVIDRDRNRAEGYAAICAETDSLRARECGYVLYRINLSFHYDRLVASLYGEFFLNAIGITIFGLFFIVYVHANVTRRSQALIDAIRRFAAGDRSTHVEVKGRNELSRLGHDVNGLFLRIRQDEDVIKKGEKQLDAIINTVVDSIITINQYGIVQSCNPATTKLFGYQRDELVGKNVSILMPENHANNHDQYLNNYLRTGAMKVIGKVRELEGRDKTGRLFPIELAVSETIFEGENLYVGVIRDISERKQLESALMKANELLFKSNLELKDSARTDTLTGVSNRRQFDYILRAEINRAARQQLPVSLIMCDVDFFKLYNDTYGHQKGDECLAMVGNSLKTVFKRSGELPARYGGEEFGVILPGMNAEQAQVRAEELLQHVRDQAIEHNATHLPVGIVTLSMGVAMMVPDPKNTDPKVLINMADEALYQAKAKGRNNVTVYNRDPSSVDEHQT